MRATWLQRARTCRWDKGTAVHGFSSHCLPTGIEGGNRQLHMNIYALMCRANTNQAWPLCAGCAGEVAPAAGG